MRGIIYEDYVFNACQLVLDFSEAANIGIVFGKGFRGHGILQAGTV